ncbi:hypothetical protein ABTH52_19840, partial [Acinetobacter baumannii]
ATTGLDVVPDASDHFRTGDGRRIVRRVAYYAGVVARVDAMAFAAFDGGSDRGYRGLFRCACRAGL